MDNHETYLAHLRCQMEAMAVVLVAVLESHPDKPALLRSIERCAKEPFDLLLDSQRTDAEIALTKSLVDLYRLRIAPGVSPL